MAPHLVLGQRGERLAAERLRREGYRLVASNFKLNVGRNLRGAIVQAEIDIVAYEGATLCFVEVKTRASDWFAAPEANVDLRKQRQITRAARAYRRLLGISGAPYRYDVASVILPPWVRAPPPRRRASNCSATSGLTKSFASAAGTTRRRTNRPAAPAVTSGLEVR